MHMIKRIKKKEIQITALFITVFVIMMVGLLVSIIYTENTKIGGVLYDEIMLSNSLTAEIMPPPMYAVEPYSVALEYIGENNLNVRKKLVDDFESMHLLYDSRYDYWKENLPQSEELRSEVLNYAYSTTDRFFSVFYDQVIPSVEAGDDSRISTAKAELISSYREHRIAVDEIVRLSVEWRQDVYSRAAEMTSVTRKIMIALVITMLIVGTVFCVLISKSERSLFRLVFYDSLTGLPSRRNIIDRLEIIISKSKDASKEFAVVFFDLDGFKKVNDRLGHDVGDALLKEVAERLEKIKNHKDTIGRLGGDEFAIVLDREADNEQIEEYLNNLKEEVKNLSLIKDTDIYLSASFGVSIYPKDGETYSELLKHADMAMYDAKHDGGNGIRFYKARNEAK